MGSQELGQREGQGAMGSGWQSLLQLCWEQGQEEGDAGHWAVALGNSMSP